MDDLVRWLGEQFDEDERAAKAACEYASPEWHLDEGATTVLMWPPEPNVATMERKQGIPVVADQWRGPVVDSAGNAGIGAHVVTWDPARVLREIDAKRALMRQIFRYESKIDGEWGCCHNADQIAAGECPETPPHEIEALQILALPYADRPGFREEWRP